MSYILGLGSEKALRDISLGYILEKENMSLNEDTYDMPTKKMTKHVISKSP